MKRRYAIAFTILLLLLCILFMWNLSTGSLSMSAIEAVKVLFTKNTDSTAYMVVSNIRLPRMLAAIVLGGALSLSGYLLQTFFNNPIVGPFVLGISSGAKLTVALAMIIFLSNGIYLNDVALIISAFIGAMLAMGFVLIISIYVRNMAVLVVCGIMIGYICSAITDFCVIFADDSNIVNLHNWALGSFSSTDWSDVLVMSVTVIVCLIVTFLMSKPISAYRFGEAYARNMGVNIKFLRIALILLSSILAACVTAFAGPISFVGVAVPHLMKLIYKTSEPIVMIPACFVGGAVITLLCDGIARTIFAPVEVSISSVTAVLLVPVVIVMMVRRRGRSI